MTPRVAIPISNWSRQKERLAHCSDGYVASKINFGHSEADPMSLTWSFSSTLSPGERLEVLALFNHLDEQLQREAIDENIRRKVIHGVGADHWLQTTDHRIVGYAQSWAGREPSVEIAGGRADEHLVSLLKQHYESKSVLHWTRDGVVIPGTTIVRELLLLEINLSTTNHKLPEGFEVREFERGKDEERWLRQNNRSFAHHPEQGQWDEMTLAQRTSEPWFDPSGFFLIERDSKIVASCWTKIHELSRERLGEIYVISVDPDSQGLGLGLAALNLGLDSIRRRGVQRAQLFVDADNVSAVRMYEKRGFVRLRTDYLLQFS